MKLVVTSRRGITTLSCSTSGCSHDIQGSVLLVCAELIVFVEFQDLTILNGQFSLMDFDGFVGFEGLSSKLKVIGKSVASKMFIKFES